MSPDDSSFFRNSGLDSIEGANWQFHWRFACGIVRAARVPAWIDQSHLRYRFILDDADATTAKFRARNILYRSLGIERDHLRARRQYFCDRSGGALVWSVSGRGKTGRKSC